MEIRWHRNANDNRFTAWRIQTRLEFTASNHWLINPRRIDRRQTDDEIPSGTCKLRIPMRETFHRISAISLEHQSSLTVMQISVYNSKGFLSPSPFTGTESMVDMNAWGNFENAKSQTALEIFAVRIWNLWSRIILRIISAQLVRNEVCIYCCIIVWYKLDLLAMNYVHSKICLQIKIKIWKFKHVTHIWHLKN